MLIISRTQSTHTALNRCCRLASCVTTDAAVAADFVQHFVNTEVAIAVAAAKATSTSSRAAGSVRHAGVSKAMSLLHALKQDGMAAVVRSIAARTKDDGDGSGTAAAGAVSAGADSDESEDDADAVMPRAMPALRAEDDETAMRAQFGDVIAMLEGMG